MKAQLPLIIVLGLLLICCTGNLRSEEVSFGRDVRPILAKHCFACHGPDPDARESGLRLDLRSSAVKDRDGYQAVSPGDANASELIDRIASDDADLRMPPADSKPALSAAEIGTLRSWINAGAKYEKHWAFLPPTKPSVPTVNDPDWCRGEIDRFLLHRMQAAGLSPSPSAEKTALVRRVYLDLVGVNPTSAEVDEFLRDDHPAAYQRLVDRLLSSPDYAERFARPWLDLARYSDTNGYEKDRPRTIWPFRDWVINAIGNDQPFDQFTIEQLAGDMLPNATEQQKIATGFHRNTMMNEEGGIDPLEFRFYAMVDRVATTGTVWMGLTTGCAQCHTHKYDPITHTDYYALMAMMNNADEPELTVPTLETDQRRKQLAAQIHRQEDRLIDEFLSAERSEPIHADFLQWQQNQIDSARDWKILRPSKMVTTMPRLSLTESGSILASGDVTKRDVYTLTMPPVDTPITALRLEVLPHESLPANGPGLAFYEGRKGDFFLSELEVISNDASVELGDPSISFGKISVGNGKAEGKNVLDSNGSTGWSTAGYEGKPNRLVVNFQQPYTSDQPWQIKLLFERHFAAGLGHFRISATSEKGVAVASKLNSQLETALRSARDGSDLAKDEQRQLARVYIRSSELLKKQRAAIEKLEKRIPSETRTLILRERDRADNRTTHRHHRGEYLQNKEVVQPAVPSVFTGLGELAPNRLGMARWLTSDKNPLVGRVTVNRAWRQFFKTGIVRTAGDFGTQSEPPTHPQLIDWMATDFVNNGWSMKRLHRKIVLSAAYRQSIAAPPRSDPTNRLLSCFPHRRLDAERLRDALLSSSGLLSRKIGGPSVYPPQATEVTKLAYGSPAWKTSSGGDRYRKSLYTFSKRTAPFAAFMTFDGSSGELCVARRGRSTTPLQALTLMNDEMFMEIAKGVADSALRDSGDQPTPGDVITHIFRRVFVRAPSDDELEMVRGFYQKHASKPNAWMLVARALINTDEAITVP